MLCLPVGIFGSLEWMTHLRSQALYVCTRACYACMFVPMQVPERARGHSQVPSAFFSRQSLSLAWNSSRKLDWLVSKPQGYFCLRFPSIGTTSLHWLLKMSFILNVIRGDQICPLRHLTVELTSPATKLLFSGNFTLEILCPDSQSFYLFGLFYYIRTDGHMACVV